MATAKRTWKKVYSICYICDQFHWKHIMAIYLQMLRYCLKYWCRRYKDTHKVIFTKTIINKYVFFGTAVLAAIFYVHSVRPFSVMYIYIYLRIQKYITMCNPIFWIWCGVSVYVYCTFRYVTSNAGFQIYRITIIHIHISTISNIFYLQDFDRLMKGYWSQKTFPPLPSRLSCALFFPKPPWLQQNAPGRKYILSVTYATNFIENT